MNLKQKNFRRYKKFEKILKINYWRKKRDFWRKKRDFWQKKKFLAEKIATFFFDA